MVAGVQQPYAYATRPPGVGSREAGGFVCVPVARTLIMSNTIRVMFPAALPHSEFTFASVALHCPPPSSFDDDEGKRKG